MRQGRSRLIRREVLRGGYIGGDIRYIKYIFNISYSRKICRSVQENTQLKFRFRCIRKAKGLMK